VRSLNEVRIWLPRMFQEAWNIGVGSLFIVLLISGFAGGVTALQARYQFTGTIPIYYLAGVIVESIVLELGPVLTGLILAGRIGARYAAELGTMRVTEQIDAMETMAVSPVQYLVVPRVVASLVMFPILTMLFNVLGYGGAYVMGIYVAGIPEGPFIQHTKEFLGPDDIFHGLAKAVVFGAIVAIITTWRGYSASGGARGVGEGTTRAVVASSVAILIADYAATVLSVGG
jgi:phospholipid/cholesterol/gamma-HCH transport system permease protein